MNNQDLFSLACELTKHYSYSEADEIVADWEMFSSPQADGAWENPRAVVKNLLKENPKKRPPFKASIILSALFSAAIFAFAVWNSAHDLYAEAKYGISVALLSVSMWFFIRGNDIASFSYLNKRLYSNTAMLLAINLLLAAVPAAILVIANRILQNAPNISNPEQIGRILHIALSVLALFSAAISAFSAVLSVKTSILHYLTCVHGLGVGAFCMSFIAAMRMFATPEAVAHRLWVCIVPYLMGILMAVLLGALIRHLLKRRGKYGGTD